MPIRWYLSKGVGTGTFIDPFRSPIEDLPLGEDCDHALAHGYDIPQRRYFLRRIGASQAKHNQIVADGLGIPISPLFADFAEEQAKMDDNYHSHDSSFKTALEAEAEANGMSTGWIGASNSLRDVIRYFVRVHSLAQWVSGKNAAFDALMKLGLNATVSDLTVAQRNAVRSWMSSRGLATGWITNTTTVRQVIHFVLENIGFGKFKFGAVEL